MRQQPPLYPVRTIVDLKDMLRQSVARYADRTAFLTKPQRGQPYVPVTYAQYGQDVTALGTALIQVLGQGQGSRTAILGDSQYEWYVSYLATVNGLSMVVPLDKELPPTELGSLLLRSEAAVLILAPAYVEKLRAALQGLSSEQLRELRLTTVVSMGESLAEPLADAPVKLQQLTYQGLVEQGRTALAAGDQSYDALEIDPTEPRFLLFTSGTTARSKAVVHNHGALAANLMATNQFVAIHETDVFFSVLPLHHTYECTCGFLIPIYNGAAIAQCEGLRYIQANLQEAKATVFLVVPLIAETFYKKITKTIQKKPMVRRAIAALTTVSNLLFAVGVDQRKRFFAKIREAFGGHLRLLIVGGAKCKPGVIESFNTFGILTIQGYGLTECAPILALNPDRAAKAESAGLPVPGVEIRVDEPDESGIGEFVARGRNILMEYYQDPEATAAVLDEAGWFHTGDLGYLDEDGYLLITGRKKNVIVTDNGKNIYPEEIEALFADSPWIQECVVYAGQGAKGEVQIGLEVFPDYDAVSAKLGHRAKVDSPELRELIQTELQAVNAKLPSYKALRQLKLRETEFEKNTSKKIKRGAPVEPTQP